MRLTGVEFNDRRSQLTKRNLMETNMHNTITQVSTTVAACVLSTYWIAFFWNAIDSYVLAA
jgi:hypothetical protein